MENKSETNIDDYYCIKCNKTYKNNSGLWKHNIKYHNPQNSSKPSSISNRSSSKSSISPNKFNNTQPESQTKLSCTNCYKKFSRSDNLKRHLITCKNKKNSDVVGKSVVHLEAENELLKEHLKKQEEFMKQLMETINKNAKIHPKTLEKINKQLNSNNSTNSYNTNSNNKMVINNTYVKFGSLSYDKILTDKQQRDILRQQRSSLTESIKRIHFNKNLPEYNNVFITNIRLVSI